MNGQSTSSQREKGADRRADKPAGWGARKFLLWGGVLLVTLVVLFYSVENLLGNGMWRDEKARWKDQLGGLPTVADLRPEPVPDAENFGALPIMQRIYLIDDAVGTANRDRLEGLSLDAGLERETSRTVKLLKETREGTLKSFRSWTEYYDLEVPAGATEEELTRAVLDELHRTRGETLTALGRGFDLPYSRPPDEFYDYLEKGNPLVTAQIPHLFGLLGTSRLLQLRAHAALRLGDRRLARECVGITMQFARYSSGRGLVGAAVAGALQVTHVWTIEEGMDRKVWTEEDLVWFEEKLRQFDWPGISHAARNAELVSVLQGMDAVKGNARESFDMMMPPDGGMPWWTLGGRVMPSGWVDRNKARVAKLYREIGQVEDGERSLWRQREAALKLERELESNPRSPSKFLVSLMHFDFKEALERFVGLEAELEQTRIALALRRYEMKRGELPEELAALVPEFLAAVPKDPVDGKPMRYEKLPGGKMKIWSVGYDGEDDGGVDSNSLPHAERKDADLVWGFSFSKP